MKIIIASLFTLFFSSNLYCQLYLDSLVLLSVEKDSINYSMVFQNGTLSFNSRLNYYTTDSSEFNKLKLKQRKATILLVTYTSALRIIEIRENENQDLTLFFGRLFPGIEFARDSTNTDINVIDTISNYLKKQLIENSEDDSYYKLDLDLKPTVPYNDICNASQEIFRNCLCQFNNNDCNTEFPCLSYLDKTKDCPYRADYICRLLESHNIKSYFKVFIGGNKLGQYNWSDHVSVIVPTIIENHKELVVIDYSFDNWLPVKLSDWVQKLTRGDCKNNFRYCILADQYYFVLVHARNIDKKECKYFQTSKINRANIDLKNTKSYNVIGYINELCREYHTEPHH